MVIEVHDKSVKRVPRSRVVFVQETRTLNEIQNTVRPLTDEALIPNTFLVTVETKDGDHNTNGIPVLEEVHKKPAEIIINNNNNSSQAEDENIQLVED